MITDPSVFRLPPFKAMGELRGVSQRFGDQAALRQATLELQRRCMQHKRVRVPRLTLF